jgi:hypothetical protein
VLVRCGYISDIWFGGGTANTLDDEVEVQGMFGKQEFS